MAVKDLNERERAVVLQCMKATAVLIDDPEIQTRLGVTHEELQAVIKQWPNVNDSDQGSNAFLSINNSLNEICHGLGINEWTSLIDATQDEVANTYRHWLRILNIRGGLR